MDYKIFLVRPPGQQSSAISGRLHRGSIRVFRILDHGISVLPLSAPSGAPTEYRFEHITKVSAADDDPTELALEILDTSKSGFGFETVRYCCDSRTSLLTALLNRLDDMNGFGTDYFLKKHSNQRGGFGDAVMRVRNASIVKMVNIGRRSDHQMRAGKKVSFQDIVKLEMLSDDEQIVLVSLKSRTLRLSIKDSLPFLCAIQRNMKANLNLDMEIKKLEPSVWFDNATAHYKKVQESPTLYEFQALKRSDSLNQEWQRTLCITQNHLIEKSFNDFIDVHSLEDLLGLIVSETNEKEVILEFRSWRDSRYFLKDRDDFIASMADVMGMGKGCNFSVRLELFHSFTFPEKPSPIYQGECETFYINRFMASYNSTREAWALHLALKEYAANIQVGDSQCTDPRVLQAVADTLKDCTGNPKTDSVRATTCCMVLLRLLASKPCFDAVRGIPEIGAVLFQCLRSRNKIISYHATVVIRAALKLAVQPGSSDVAISSKIRDMGRADPAFILLCLQRPNKFQDHQEVANRLSVLSADYLQQLVALLHTHALSSQNSLQVTGLLDILTTAFSSPPTENDAGRLWLRAFEASIMASADLLCTIFRSTSDVVFTRLSLLLQALLTKMSPVVCGHLQRICLGRCVFLLHLSTAIFSKNPRLRLLSCNQIFLIMEGNYEAKKLFESLVPQGVMNLYANKVDELPPADKTMPFSAWKDTIELLHAGNLETPLLVWNDIKRSELKTFLRDEMEGYFDALEANPNTFYNTSDVKLIYSTASEGGGSVIRGIHLELLVDHLPPAHGLYNTFWKLGDPLPIFQSVFQAMLLGFTPFFGHNNLPDIDLRLAVHTLTWIYERYADEVTFCMETLKVIETVVGMLREVIDSEHEVFVFKLVMFLLAAVNNGRMENVTRLIRAGGAAVLVPLVVLSVDKCCKNKMEFECDAWTGKDAPALGTFEMVPVVGTDGVSKLVRIPSGRAQEVLGKSVQDGSRGAKEGIKWQDKNVPPKIQIGLALDLLETLLRVSTNNANKEHYPPPAAVLSLSKVETLCHIVQLLLRLKSPFFSRILEILSTLAKTNKKAMARLYSLGAFEILLWKLLAGDLTDWEKDLICKFLLQVHLHQDQGSVTSSTNNDEQEEQPVWKSSILRYYLPDGLILKLMSEGADSFAAVVAKEQDEPDIIWNMDMRQRLLDHLTNELEQYVKFRASDSMALYVHKPQAPLYYPELAECVFSAPFYLQNLLDKQRFPAFPINDPASFLSSLIVNLRKVASTGASVLFKEIPGTHLLLQAQAHVINRFPELTLPSDAETLVITLASPSLQACLNEKEYPPQFTLEILQHAVIVLRRFCAINIREDNVPLESLNFALEILSLGTQWNVDKSSDINLELAISNSLAILEVLSSTKTGRQHLWDDSRWQEGMWWALCIVVEDANSSNSPISSSPVSFGILSCLKHFATDGFYCQQIIERGYYLHLLAVAIPPPPEVDHPKVHHKANLALPISAADVLGSLVRALNLQKQEFDVMSILANLMPRALISCLEKDEDPDKFITLAGSDIKHPTVVWTADVRGELHTRVLERLLQYKQLLPNRDEVQWLQKFKYSCLEKEFVLGGVFVNSLAAGQWQEQDLPENPLFMELMMKYLERDCTIVPTSSQIGVEDEPEPEPEEVYDKYIISEEGKQEKPGEPVEIEVYITVLVALKECLKFAVSKKRTDLMKFFHLSILQEITSSDRCVPKVWVEVMAILRILSEDETTRNSILRSSLLGTTGIHLWNAMADVEEVEMEAVLTATLDMLLFLTENLKATVIEDTHYFLSSGVLFPLLCLFCDVDLPSLGTGIMEAGKISGQHRLVAARTLGQLLLCESGISHRVEFLEALGLRKVVSSNDFGVLGIIEIYDAMNLHVPGCRKKQGQVDQCQGVIQTLLLLLPLDFVLTIALDPPRSLELYESTVYSPLIVWDEDTRYCVTQILMKEAINLQKYIKIQVLPGLGPWTLDYLQPVFARWILATVVPDGEGEGKPTYRSFKEEGYVAEMYLGGFFLDQFLRKPEYYFGEILERRFLREVQQAVVVGAHAEEIDDLRRLLLSLLLLFKGRPYLLAGRSNIDIFLAVNHLICSTGKEGRALAQLAMLVTHFIANHKDVVDCIVSEELVSSLMSFLDLKVPLTFSGFSGTDPRLCSLMLLLRLIRLGQATIEITSKKGVVSKLVDIVLDMAENTEVSKTALECLAIMVHDKRKGQDVIRLLETLVPAESRGFWDIPVATILDDVVDLETLQHFLQHRHPCAAWWVSDNPEANIITKGDDIISMSVFPVEKDYFNSVATTDSENNEEEVLKHSISLSAPAKTWDVQLSRKFSR